MTTPYPVVTIPPNGFHFPDYWKIKHPLHGKTLSARQWKAPLKKILDERNFRYPPTDTVAQLTDFCERLAKGILVYAKCSQQELEKFCIDRLLVSSEGRVSRLTKPQLVELLDAADEACEFRKFSDLPTELRVMIYKFTFKSIEQDISVFQSPQLCLVSRLVRIESLPLFFSECRFAMRVYPVPPSASSGQLARYRFNPAASHLLGEMPWHLLSGIGHLNIAVKLGFGAFGCFGGKLGRIDGSWTINVPSRPGATVVAPTLHPQFVGRLFTRDMMHTPISSASSQRLFATLLDEGMASIFKRTATNISTNGKARGKLVKYQFEYMLELFKYLDLLFSGMKGRRNSDLLCAMLEDGMRSIDRRATSGNDKLKQYACTIEAMLDLFEHLHYIFDEDKIMRAVRRAKKASSTKKKSKALKIVHPFNNPRLPPEGLGDRVAIRSVFNFNI